MIIGIETIMEIQEFYNRWWERREKENWRKTTRQKILSEYSLSKTKNLNDIVLDIGAGDGIISQSLVERGHYVVGIDISTVPARKCQEKGIDTVICDIRKGLPFVDKSFHVTLLYDFLEHTFEPDKILEETRRVTTERMLINIPNPLLWVWRIQYLIGRIPYPFRSGHVQWWTLREFINFLERLGLKISDISYIPGHFPFQKRTKIHVRLGLMEWITKKIPDIFSENLLFTIDFQNEYTMIE
jgi:methionine biosynthesis protein MetW